jgi:hypothetical protein
MRGLACAVSWHTRAAYSVWYSSTHLQVYTIATHIPTIPMKTFTERFYSAMENQLNEIELNNDSLAEQYRASILVCKKAMKKYIVTYSFESQEEAIIISKKFTPQFYNKYIYSINVYHST